MRSGRRRTHAAGSNPGSKLSATESNSEQLEPLWNAEEHRVRLDRSGWGPGGRRFKSCLPDRDERPANAGLSASLECLRDGELGCNWGAIAAGGVDVCGDQPYGGRATHIRLRSPLRQVGRVLRSLVDAGWPVPQPAAGQGPRPRRERRAHPNRGRARSPSIHGNGAVRRPPTLVERSRTVDEVADELRERLAIEGARLSYRQNCESMQRIHVSPAIGSRRVDSVTRQDVERIGRSMLGRGLAPKTVPSVMTFLHSIFGLAVANESMLLA